MNVKLTWTDNNTSETGHRVYRSSSPMDTADMPPPVAELGPDVTEWEDTDTPVDQVVYYIVSALRGAEEAFSGEVMIDTGAPYDPYWDQVVSLMHFDTDLLDKTGKNWTGNAAINQAYSKFGLGSLFCDNGPFIETGASEDWAFGTGDFTVEAQLDSYAMPSFLYFSPMGNWAANTGWCFFLEPNGVISWHGNVTLAIKSARGVFSLLSWVHVAYAREAGIGRLFLNGVMVATAPDTQDYASTAGPRIGGNRTATDWWRGYIDEVRVTKGVARYTEDFTPPTEPFPNFGPPPGPAPTLPTVIGEAYGGGFYAGDIESDGQWYKLIVADVSADITGENSRWKTSNSTTAGTDSLTDGVANTASMIAAGIALHPAADHCINHSGGGNSDWYMPAKDELNVIYQNLGYARPNCPPDFQTGGQQAFSGNWYWASTQFVYNLGWIQHFGNGNQTNSGKTNTGNRVRPVRRIAFTP